MTLFMPARRLGFGLLLSLLLFGGGFSAVRSFAAGEADHTIALTRAVGGSLFRLYRVGEIRDGNICLTDGFAGYPVSFGDGSASAARAAASTLESFILRDHVTPRNEGKADVRGTLRFPDLPEGIYLILGETAEQDGMRCEPEPCLVSVGYGSETRMGSRRYTEDENGVTAVLVKYSRLPVPPAPTEATEETAPETTKAPEETAPEDMPTEHAAEKPSPGGNKGGKETAAETKAPSAGEIDMSITVRKIWQDQGMEKMRPSLVSAELLDNGERAGTVVLSEENGWTYTWYNRDPGHSFRVLEKEVPEGYSFTSVREGQTFFLTNYAGMVSGKYLNIRNLSGSGKKDRRFPQTGLMWQPFFAALFIGIGCLMAAAFLFAGNIRADRQNGAYAARLAGAVRAETGKRNAKREPGAETDPDGQDYRQHPEIAMPVIRVDGNPCIGWLEIPALGLVLPVGPEAEKSVLRKYPCRFSGTAYRKNMVLCGHNYRSEFGPVRELRDGAEVNFTDTEGNCFRYVVAGREKIGPEETERICDGIYPLALITCTAGGSRRIAIFCREKREN